MQIAGPRAMAEGFTTVLQSLTSGKDEIPHWVSAPSLITRPVILEEQEKQRKKSEELELGIPGL